MSTERSRPLPEEKLQIRADGGVVRAWGKHGVTEMTTVGTVGMAAQEGHYLSIQNSTTLLSNN